jgi:hypothetical protein
VIGDNGRIDYTISGNLSLIQTDEVPLGGNDTINVGNGDNVVLGGYGNDLIETGQDTDMILNENGYFQFTTNQAGLTILTVGSARESTGLTGASDVTRSNDDSIPSNVPAASITIKNMRVKDSSVPLTLTAEGDICLQVGGGTDSNNYIDVQASAGGNLKIMTEPNGGSPVTLKPRADLSSGIALSAGQNLTLLLAGSLDLSNQPSTGAFASVEFFRANRMEMLVGIGSVASATSPLRINTGINTNNGLAVKLTTADASASLLETAGDLRLVLPTAFSSSSALTIGRDLNLTVNGGDLLDATGYVINPVNNERLANQDSSLKITGAAATTAAYAEIAEQDRSNYATYWTTYRGWTKNSSGKWVAPRTAIHTESIFTFTLAEINSLKSSKGLTDAAIATYQYQLNDIHQKYRTATYSPTFIYSRPVADQQSYLDQRVIGRNTYYNPLTANLNLLLFPLQSEKARMSYASFADVSGTGNTAIITGTLNLVVKKDSNSNSGGAIGRSSDLVKIDIPDGGYDMLSENDAKLLSAASTTDLVSQNYKVFKYIGNTDLITPYRTTSLNLADASLFTLYTPDYTAGNGPLYQYVGTAPLINFNLSTADFGAKDSSNRNLWRAVNSGTATYNTTNTSLSLAVGDLALVMDSRAQLATNQVVLVRTPSFYGYYEYKGSAARRDLLQEDYGNTSLWNALTIGSQSAQETTTNHSTTITRGTLLTDPFALTGVTLRRQTPVTVAVSGTVSAKADAGIRLISAEALTIQSVEASGTSNLTAASFSQDAAGIGVSNNRSTIELKSTNGGIGTSAARLKITTADDASLYASTSSEGGNSAFLSSSSDLAIGSLVAAGTLDIISTGSITDFGRNSSNLSLARVNLQAPTLNLSAPSAGTVVTPLIIGGGGKTNQTTVTATSGAGVDGLMAFASKGSTPVMIKSLTISSTPSSSTPVGSVWLSGNGFVSVVGTSPVITAATLVLDGLPGIGASADPLRTAISRLAGSVGLNGVFLTNTTALSIDSVTDSTGTRSYPGLSTDATSTITTIKGAVTITKAFSASAGNINLNAATNLLIANTGTITTGGSSNIALNANTTGGMVDAAVGSVLQLNSSGTATITGANLILQGMIDATSKLVFAPMAGRTNLTSSTTGSQTFSASAIAPRNLTTYLTPAQKNALIATGIAATSLDGNTANGEITTNLILGGTLISRNVNGFTYSTSSTLTLLGDITCLSGSLNLSSSSTDGLMMFGNLTAPAITLTASAGSFRGTSTSKLTSKKLTSGSSLRVVSAKTARFLGSILTN